MELLVQSVWWILHLLKCIVKLPSRKVIHSFHFLEHLLSLSVIIKKKALFQFDRQNNVLLFLCTKFLLAGVPRGSTDISVNAFSPPPDFSWTSQSSMRQLKIGFHTKFSLCGQFCFNPPLNPKLSCTVGGISSPACMVFLGMLGILSRSATIMYPVCSGLSSPVLSGIRRRLEVASTGGEQSNNWENKRDQYLILSSQPTLSKPHLYWFLGVTLPFLG